MKGVFKMRCVVARARITGSCYISSSISKAAKAATHAASAGGFALRARRQAPGRSIGDLPVRSPGGVQHRPHHDSCVHSAR